mgnify:CR=1 FL=1
MYHLTVNVFKIIRWAGPLPHDPPYPKGIEGFGGKGVKYRSASKKKTNPYLIMIKNDNNNFQTTNEVRTICFERCVTILQGRQGHSISGYWRF